MEKGTVVVRVFLAVLLLSFAGCALLRESPRDYLVAEKVLVSYYGGSDGFEGKLTASGERFNPHDLTAAHKTLPFGSKIQLTNPRTNKIVIVRINDRGPFVEGRIIDLSRKAATKLQFINAGLTEVKIKYPKKRLD